MTGLFYVVAIILVMPAVGTVMNVVLSGLFTHLTVTLSHEVIISIITTLVAAVLLATSVRVVAILNSIGVVLELLVLLGAAVALLFHQHQSVSILGSTGGVQGHGSYLWPFLVVIALVVTQLVGFETAGAFAEEPAGDRADPQVGQCRGGRLPGRPGGRHRRDDREGTGRDHQRDYVRQRDHRGNQAAVRELRVGADAVSAGRLAGFG